MLPQIVYNGILGRDESCATAYGSGFIKCDTEGLGGANIAIAIDFLPSSTNKGLSL